MLPSVFPKDSRDRRFSENVGFPGSLVPGNLIRDSSERISLFTINLYSHKGVLFPSENTSYTVNTQRQCKRRVAGTGKCMGIVIILYIYSLVHCTERAMLLLVNNVLVKLFMMDPL